MPFIKLSDITAAHVDKPFERDLKIAMSPQTHPEVHDFTFLISELAPNGGCTDFHTHDAGGELMIFISGHGRAWLGDQEYEITPGTAMYAPPGLKHKTLNTGDTILQIACVFVPPVNTDYILANIEAAKKAGE